MSKKVKDTRQPWMVLGAPVFYHSVIGEPPTLATRIREEPWLLSGHTWVLMVEGKSGCVCCEAVSHRQESAIANA